MSKNIVLIGGRATGKSHIGRLLADRLKRPYYDMDDLIIYEVYGQKIPKLTSSRGWHVFRNIEAIVAIKLSTMRGAVISAGGGVVCDQDEDDKQFYSQRKVDALKKNSVVVWLHCSVATQIARMEQDDANRPSITGTKSTKEEMLEVMQLRYPWYEKAADVAFDTEKESPEEIIEKILALPQLVS